MFPISRTQRRSDNLSFEQYILIMNMTVYRAISRVATMCCICRKGSGDNVKADKNCVEMRGNEKLEGGESNATRVNQMGGRINYALEQER